MADTFGSNLAAITSNMAYTMSNDMYPSAMFSSNVSAELSNLMHPRSLWSSNAVYFSSNVSANTSNDLFPRLGFSSNTAVGASNIAAYSSNKCIDMSNSIFPTSVFASNTAINSHYKALFASNISLYCSNNITPISNCASYASNCAQDTSNSTYNFINFSSNKIVSASNASEFASNAAFFSSNLVTLTNPIAYFAYSNTIYASNSVTLLSTLSTNTSNVTYTTSNYVFSVLPSVTETANAASNYVFTASTVGWRFNSSNLYTVSNMAIGTTSNANHTIDVGQGSIGCSNIYHESCAFRFFVDPNTVVIASNYDPGVSSVGSNNNPINGLIPFSTNDSTMPFQTITHNGFSAPKKGIYILTTNVGISCRGYDCVQLVMTQTPSNRGPLSNQDTLSNIRAFSIATTETWGIYNSGNVSVNHNGYIQPQTATLALHTINALSIGDTVQCFLITHHTSRSNAATTLVNVQSNTPVAIALASNNPTSSQNPATGHNYFSGVLITNLM